MSSVLVLNAGYEPMRKVSLRHAIRMIVREVAVIEEASDEMYGPFPKPVVLRLVRYVKMTWRKPKPKWSKSRLFVRDGGKCAYCGKEAATVDHIFPKCRGGEDTWTNTVASCFKCNNKKGNRTPEQAGMKLLIQPYEPSWQQINF